MRRKSVPPGPKQTLFEVKKAEKDGSCGVYAFALALDLPVHAAKRLLRIEHSSDWVSFAQMEKALDRLGVHHKWADNNQEILASLNHVMIVGFTWATQVEVENGEATRGHYKVWCPKRQQLLDGSYEDDEPDTYSSSCRAEAFKRPLRSSDFIEPCALVLY